VECRPFLSDSDAVNRTTDVIRRLYDAGRKMLDARPMPW
jgi:hypothetical protein